jgi:hypothetical protein
MHEAYIKDVEAIKSKRPAFSKLFISRNLYTRLKKRETEIQFIDRKGLELFAYWLDPIEVDGELRYPNINIAEGVLQYLKGL